MKPWAELTAGARGARVGGVVAVVAAILWGAVSLRGGPHGGPEGDRKPDPAMVEAEPGKAAPTETAAATAPAPEAPATAADPPAPDAAAEPVAEPAADPAPEIAAAPAEEPAAETVEPAAPAVAAPALPAPPSLDVVRIEQDGSAVIAGKGAPGSSLSLRVDGAEIIALPVDAAGNFVGMFSLPPSDAARALSAVMVLADGTEIPAGATVAIAPTVAPVIAQAEVTDPAQPAEPAAAEPAAAAPAALMVTEAGAKVLQGIGDGTVAAANVTVDAISYTPEGAVVLAGRGTAGALVRLYLDNAATAEATVAQAGDWTVTLADTQPGIYTLRVDQLDAGGNVTSRFETPFKRESLAALAAAAAPAADPAATETAASAAAVTETATTETAAVETASGETATPDTAAPEPAAAATATETAPATAPEVATTAAEPAAPAELAAAVPAAPAPEATPEAAPEPAATASTDSATAPATEVVAEAPAAEPAPVATPAAPIQITVQPGYTLWRIARENLGDGVMYVQVFEANKDQIRDPDLIYPGQIFTLAPKE